VSAKGQLSKQPPRGTSDWWPEEYKIRKYIFDTWRSVCERFGYREYLTPLVEYADIYRAKSGEDVGGRELTVFKDRGGRELAIRPEMTPSVTRMVSQKYQALSKPVRFFSIANFFRNERPQRGRNREFWQLNYDIFGEESINADMEVIQAALEIMLAFNPPQDSFVVYINDRRLINLVLEAIGVKEEKERVKLVRLLDKWDKMGEKEFREMLIDQGVGDTQVDGLMRLMRVGTEEQALSQLGLDGIQEVLDQTIHPVISGLSDLGYEKWLQFKPSLVRGFDYYDGIVFEVFDKHPQNNRSLFGGGRYDSLTCLFGERFPATGCAPGDETTRLFLEAWGLIGKLEKKERRTRVFIPLLDKSLMTKVMMLAGRLRGGGEVVEIGLSEQKLGQALEYANKKGFQKVVFLGSQEVSRGVYVVKDMKTGAQEEFELGV